MRRIISAIILATFLWLVAAPSPCPAGPVARTPRPNVLRALAAGLTLRKKVNNVTFLARVFDDRKLAKRGAPGFRKNETVRVTFFKQRMRVEGKRRPKDLVRWVQYDVGGQRASAARAPVHVAGQSLAPDRLGLKLLRKVGQNSFLAQVTNPNLLRQRNVRDFRRDQRVVVSVMGGAALIQATGPRPSRAVPFALGAPASVASGLPTGKRQANMLPGANVLAGALQGGIGQVGGARSGSEMIQQNQQMNAEFLALQNQMQMESRQYNAVSNALKVRHDTAASRIDNKK